MKTRAEFEEYMRQMVNGTHADCTSNHYSDAITALNKILDIVAAPPLWLRFFYKVFKIKK